MTCGIYMILNSIDGKAYVGKSKKIEARFRSHKWALNKSICVKDCNRYLYNSVKKYGIENFKFIVIEVLENDDKTLSERELFWMIALDTINYGYNLRLDSSSGMVVHEKTRKLMSEITKGSSNPNFNNKWSESQKLKMSEIAKNRHASGQYYGEAYRKKISLASKKTWSDLEKRKQMSKKVKVVKRKYKFHQYDRDGTFIKTWLTVDEILEANPTWKWQNIYSACNGYKPTYQGFIWKKELL